MPATLRSAVAFAGPAFLVAVGYIDSGNWGTDLAAGSRYGYRSLWVLVFATAVAIFLQSVAARLGIATGADLATLLGARLSRPARVAFWSVAESGMLATEMAEFLGAVAGIHLLFGVGLPVAVPVAAGLVIGTLAFGGRQRRMEYVIFGLLAVVTGGYVVELWLSGPGPHLLGGLVPGAVSSDALLIAVGMVGATVMPHNLFLHSGLILTRVGGSRGDCHLCRRAAAETVLALNLHCLSTPRSW